MSTPSNSGAFPETEACASITMEASWFRPPSGAYNSLSREELTTLFRERNIRFVHLFIEHDDITHPLVQLAYDDSEAISQQLAVKILYK